MYIFVLPHIKHPAAVFVWGAGHDAMIAWGCGVVGFPFVNWGSLVFWYIPEANLGPWGLDGCEIHGFFQLDVLNIGVTTRFRQAQFLSPSKHPAADPVLCTT